MNPTEKLNLKQLVENTVTKAIENGSSLDGETLDAIIEKQTSIYIDELAYCLKCAEDDLAETEDENE